MRAAEDAALVACAFAACPLVALAAPDSPAGPLRNAAGMRRLEQALGIWSEPRVHAWASTVPGLLTVLLVFYLAIHVPATVGALVWAWLERPAAFAVARNAFLLTQALVIAGYLLLPVAPPRMLAAPGSIGAEHWARALQSPYAAFPSGHVAFAVIAGGIVWRLAGPAWIRALAALYPLVVCAVVVASANHYWLDAVGGAAAAGLGAAAALVLRRDGPVAARVHRARVLGPRLAAEAGSSGSAPGVMTSEPAVRR